MQPVTYGRAHYVGDLPEFSDEDHDLTPLPLQITPIVIPSTRASNRGKVILSSKECYTTFQPREVKKNTRVEGNLHGSGLWLPGMITRLREGGTFDIVYDNGEQEKCKDRNGIRIDYSHRKPPTKMERKKCHMDHYFPEDNCTSSLSFVSDCDICATIPIECFECGVVKYHSRCVHKQVNPSESVTSLIDTTTTIVAATNMLSLLSM